MRRRSPRSPAATGASAANPKFALQLPQVRLRTSGSKRHENHRVASVLRFRSSLRSVRQARANFGIGTLAGNCAIKNGMNTTAPGPNAAPARPHLPGLSIVVPVHNEAAGLPALHARVAEAVARLNGARPLHVEIVYVDDGSGDATAAVARDLPADGLDVQVVSLSRNFGKEAGMLAGLDHARLGAVLFMDGDGQHPPALVDRSEEHTFELQSPYVLSYA